LEEMAMRLDPENADATLADLHDVLTDLEAEVRRIAAFLVQLQRFDALRRKTETATVDLAAIVDEVLGEDPGCPVERAVEAAPAAQASAEDVADALRRVLHFLRPPWQRPWSGPPLRIRVHAERERPCIFIEDGELELTD